jgi:ribosomal protein S18 acetylase RimI-like enzyme
VTEGYDRERAVRFLREFAVRTAGRVEELPFGVAVFNDELPSVWDLNLVWIDAVPRRFDAALLARELDRIQGAAGLRHRQAIVADEPGGDRLAPGVLALGWNAKRHLLMVQRRAPDRAADVSRVLEVGEPAIRKLTETSLRNDAAGFSEEAIRQIAGQKRIVAAAGARFFAVELNGTVVSGCDLFLDRGIAQIESVMTLEEYRNRGLARAVVAKAIEAARGADAELVFLQAEEDDWPKELYEKLGFDIVGATHVLLRNPCDGRAAPRLSLTRRRSRDRASAPPS